MSAYEDVLYGSESDLADTDDEVERDRPTRTVNNKSKKTQVNLIKLAYTLL
jgi:hypothetical protein